MKVYLIKASASGGFKDYKKYMGAPPQNIFSTAACTPAGVEIEMTDETADMRINYKSKADIVAIFMSTPDAVRAYEIADKFRELGKTVVFGGLHTAFLPEEAKIHADTVMIGEVEEIWEQLLEDYSCGQLKSVYQRTELFDLALLKPYPTDIIPASRYQGVWSVMVGRGCINKCSYCAVCPFFKTMRFRPIEDIVAEIRDCGAEWVELHADNLTADRDYALRLFYALKPLKIKWVGETTLNLADDDELLQAAAESGLSFLLVGLETPSRKALQGAGKGFVSVEKVKSQIEKFHRFNIMVDSGFLFGFDEHDTNIFQETYDFAKEINLDSIHSIIVIPFPGTKFYNDMKDAGRLLTDDWSKYDGLHAIFRPAQMTAQELEEGAWWFYQKSLKMGKNLVKSGTYGSLSELFDYDFPILGLLELLLIISILFLNISWLWASLFLLWSLSAIFSGYTGMFQPVYRYKNPIIFWTMTLTWVILSLLMFIPQSFWDELEFYLNYYSYYQ